MAASTATPAATPVIPRWRRALSLLLSAATLLAVVLWLLLLRPQFLLDGPAGYVMVSGVSMQPTLQNADFVVVRRQSSYRSGDVIAYKVPKGEPGAGHTVIHRIIGGANADGYRTQGDNRSEPDMWRPRDADITGRLWLHVPQGAKVLGVLGQPLPMAIAAGALVFFYVMSGGSGREPRRRKPG